MNNETAIRSILIDELNIDETEITLDGKFSDYGADSLDHIDIIMRMEERFGIAIPDEDMDDIYSVRSAVDYLKGETK